VKFREFVGEEKVRKVRKKVIQTNIGPTEEDFLKQVLREKPDGSKIKKGSSIEKFLHFGLSKQRLKRVFDYIKSWLIRYDVPFKPLNPCLTLYLLRNLPTNSTLVDKIKKTKSGIVYKPKGTISIVSIDESTFPRPYMNLEGEIGKDYILLDYFPNEYNLFLEGIMIDMNIKILYDQCYVKLFEIKSEVMTPKLYKDMMFSCPKFPDLKLGNVGLLRSK
jgi:hypothetical protein